jgi:hypothetical protein
MRKITFKDSFALSRILDKTNLTADLNKVVEEGKEKGTDYVGGQFFLLLAKKWHLAEKEIIDFLASLFELTSTEVEKLTLSEVKDLFKELFSSEDIKKLFTQAVEE